MSKFLIESEIKLEHINGSRPRYKTVDGVKVCEYDRLHIGQKAGARPWLSALSPDPDRTLYWFMLGVKNVILVYDPTESRLYVNPKAGAQAQEYIKAYKRLFNVQETVEVEGLPTADRSRTGGGRKVETIEDLARAALARADKIDIDL